MAYQASSVIFSMRKTTRKMPTKVLSNFSKGNVVKNAVTGFNVIRGQSTFFGEAVSEEALSKARPFEEIPGPKELPFLGNAHRYFPLIGEYSISSLHESQFKKFKQYGPIVREKVLPGYTIVHLFCPKEIETVYRNEGKYPTRDIFKSLKQIREDEAYSSVGLVIANGKEWHEMRTSSQKHMMRPQMMKSYLPQINMIGDDLIQNIRRLRQPNHQVPMLMDEFYKWALESMTYILFNERMGCLDENMAKDSMSQKYIEAAHVFFQLLSKVEFSLFPIWRKYPSLSPSFKKLKNAHDFIFNNALEHVSKKMKDINFGKVKNDENQGSLLERLLESMSPRDASVIAVDSMSGGIDTTSYSLAFVLHHLAANPKTQRKLQEEVDRYVPDGKPLTEEVLDKMDYLRACIKESMRINPTAQGTKRTLDKDIVLSNYRIPANTEFSINYNVTSMQESYFKDATSFKPERWLRDENGKKITPDSFAFLPFGFGPRMCLGRRIAELELCTLLTKIMQNFWLENKSTDLKIRFQLVLMIDGPLRFEFHERRKQ